MKVGFGKRLVSLLLAIAGILLILDIFWFPTRTVKEVYDHISRDESRIAYLHTVSGHVYTNPRGVYMNFEKGYVFYAERSLIFRAPIRLVFQSDGDYYKAEANDIRTNLLLSIFLYITTFIVARGFFSKGISKEPFYDTVVLLVAAFFLLGFYYIGLS